MSRRTNKKRCPVTSQKPTRRSKSVTNITDQGNVLDLNPEQWLLPETKEYLKGNDHKPNAENEDQIETTPIETKKTPTAYDEVKSYLKKNSLVAKGLTIFDVLYPTSLTVRDPRHVQVIDRYVLAKVWDDILPLAYGSYVGKLRLVNHYAVDLVKYEINLRELITNYYQFTSDFIWKHLSDEDKRKHGPCLYWNSLKNDEQNKIRQEITKEEHTNQSALENFAWRKLNDDEQNDLLKKPAVYEGPNQTVLKTALKDAESECALKAVHRMDVEIHRAIKFLQISTDLRQLQKRAEMDSKPKPPKRKPSVDRNFGQRVICRFDDDGFFYAGTIQKNHDGRTIVLFDIGIKQEVIGHILLPINGAIAQPNLFVKDCVLVRQMNVHREFWAPGIVIILPSPAARQPSLYTVQIYTPSPHQVHVPRRDMLKISLGLFQRTLLYLQNVDHPPIPPPVNHDGLSPSSFEYTLRKRLQPLTTKVEHLHKSHNRRYYKLKKALEDQMAAINLLQGKTPDTTPIDQPTQIPKIPVGSGDEGKSDPPTRTPTPPTTPIEDFIKPNTKVYAVWVHEDVLAYEGTVIEKQDGSNAYTVRRDDLPSNLTIISRHDIYLRKECKTLKELKLKSFVLIKYPKDSRQCWSPAVILQHHPEKSQTRVRFYDCIDEYRSNNEYAIEITRLKFQEYVTLRIEFEKQLCGQVIVGLNNETRTYMLGTIIERIESGHKYIVHWCDETKSEQTEEHLFGAFTKRNQHQMNNRVLAIDREQYIYKPAIVIGHSKDWKMLTVRYTDPEENDRENDVQADTTFVITERYYQLIIKTVSSRFVEKTRSPLPSSSSSAPASASRALISLEVYNN